MACTALTTFEVSSGTQTAVYTIEFAGVTVSEGHSTWCYRVFVAGDPALSHWVVGAFELCQELLEQRLISVTRNGVSLQEGTGYELGFKDGVFGIKFNIGTSEEQSPVLYCIELDGIYQSTNVDVAVKGGPSPAQARQDAICGPSCEAVLDRQPIRDITESIALQQAGLAHIINAEGEKIQAVCAELSTGTEDLIAIDRSVQRILRNITKLEIILEFKLEELSRF